MLTLLVAEACAPAHYDGVRHGLPVLPVLALLSGLALQRAWAPAAAAVSPSPPPWRGVSCSSPAFIRTTTPISTKPMQAAWRGRGEEWVDLEYSRRSSSRAIPGFRIT